MAEQIVDGVDVSSCKFYNNGVCEEIMDSYGGYIDKCVDCPNCYYKKLQRKIDEHNKITDLIRDTEIYSEVCDTCKDEILIYPSISGKTNYTDNEVDIITLKKIIDRLKYKEQECEELKTQKNILVEGYIKRFKKCHHYEQSLNEIKNVWENDEDGDYDFLKFQILNIINKAKDSNNE